MSHSLKFVTNQNVHLMAIPANNVISKYGVGVIVVPHFNKDLLHNKLQGLRTCNLNAKTNGQYKCKAIYIYCGTRVLRMSFEDGEVRYCISAIKLMRQFGVNNPASPALYTRSRYQLSSATPIYLHPSQLLTCDWFVCLLTTCRRSVSIFKYK